MLEGFNNYDLFIISFLAITTIFGFVRGLSGELCSFLKIIIAAALSAYSVVVLHDMFFQGKSGIISNIVLSVVPGFVFFLVNIILGIFLFPVKEFIRALLPFVLDRILGVVVSFVKNMFIIILIHIVLTVGVQKISGKELKWVSNAKLAKVLDEGADEVLDTGIIQKYIKKQIKGNDKPSSAKKGKDKDGIVNDLKSKYDSLFEGDEDNKQEDVNTIKSGDESSSDEETLGEKFDRVKDLYDSLGDEEKEEVQEVVKDKASSVSLDKVKDFIDDLKS
ncbi:MAG: CvpA family protein [Rickettsiales bacterium]|jgi:uncharacterized membrane protein required for colicin V production|nr:CvpA family protein [Rickettsiales bacterium]